MAEEKRDWRELCVAITNERDRTKLLDLMEELLAAIDERVGSNPIETTRKRQLGLFAKTRRSFVH
jgi:hypothetical protein